MKCSLLVFFPFMLGSIKTANMISSVVEYFGMGRSQTSTTQSPSSIDEDPKSMVFRNLAPVDYASETLAMIIQKSVIAVDDEIAKRQYKRRNKVDPDEWFFRSQPLVISCKPDENRSMLSSGYIVCSATLT